MNVLKTFTMQKLIMDERSRKGGRKYDAIERTNGLQPIAEYDSSITVSRRVEAKGSLNCGDLRDDANGGSGVRF